jgi:peroxiredoxin/predicted 2-oxoglutarate/Fe(II)-dependent dioxygenase YbiX
MIQVGEPAPWFVGRTTVNPQYDFNTVAGRYVVLSFFGSLSEPSSCRVFDAILCNRQHFDDEHACFFGVSVDPRDQADVRLVTPMTGVRIFWDFDHAVSRLFTAASGPASDRPLSIYRRFSLVLDERLRVLNIIPFGESPDDHVLQLLAFLRTLPALPAEAPAESSAPVLLLPRIFEPEFCATLVEYYETHGGLDSGYVRDIGGQSVNVFDHRNKQRRDCVITNEGLRIAAMHRIYYRLLPELLKAFQFQATKIERYLVACYDSETGGHFGPHRDNTKRGTAHRRFAVSLNLNSEFEGGNLRFPEFGRQTYRPPIGGAMVFSCSLLHEATPLTKGKRYTFLPFLYDGAAAAIRQKNLRILGNEQTWTDLSQHN